MSRHLTRWAGRARVGLRGACTLALGMLALTGLPFDVAFSSDTLGAVEVEVGAVWVGRADVRIPGDDGTRFSLRDDLDSDESAYIRTRLSWHPGERHTVLLTLAPLEVTASGPLPRDIRFADTEFSAGSPAKATYRFNNYRLTYRYLLHTTDRFTLELGGTLFVRDAKVTLETPGRRDSDSDVGLVPLLHIRMAYAWTPQWVTVLDGDALAAPQGRAIDVLAALAYQWNEQTQISVGYRLVEGGADNDSVYTFALFHHLAAAARWRF